MMFNQLLRLLKYKMALSWLIPMVGFVFLVLNFSGNVISYIQELRKANTIVVGRPPIGVPDSNGFKQVRVAPGRVGSDPQPIGIKPRHRIELTATGKLTKVTDKPAKGRSTKALLVEIDKLLGGR